MAGDDGVGAPEEEELLLGHRDAAKDELDSALMWKIDLRLIPFLSFLYLITFMDRANIANAKIEGLVEDLNMTDQQYLWTLTAFFIPYAILETPSNILLKKLRPSVWLPTIVLTCGICLTLMGFVRGFTGLLLCRIALGVAEAGLAPGVAYYLSCWYRRREYGRRVAIFISAAILSGACGGFLAAAIAEMDGIGGHPGWAWIFIIEGLVTVSSGVAAFWLIADFPDKARFLTKDERALIVSRLQADSQRSAGRQENFTMDRLITACKDWKTWFGAVIYSGVTGPAYALALFTPSIILELGFSSTQAQLLSVPPSILGCVTSIAVGFAADARGERGTFNFLCLPIAIFGMLLNLIPSAGAGVRYIGVYLAAAGLNPCVSNTVAWVSNNFEGSYKRGIVMAIVISLGTIQGSITSNVYRAVDAPHYTFGHSVVLGYLAVSLVASVGFSVLLRAENRKRDRGEREYRIKLGTEEEAAELGDQHPHFRYTV